MLIGKKIKLRALEPIDIDLLYEWENNTDVWNISDTIQPFSRFAIEQYVNSVQDVYNQKQIRFIIEEISSNLPVGCVDLFDFDARNKRIGVGILVTEQNQRNKGFGSEAIDLILEYCEAILECHQVYCNILVSNDVSIKLFKKHGFVPVGIKKDWIRINKEMHDEILLQKIF